VACKVTGNEKIVTTAKGGKIYIDDYGDPIMVVQDEDGKVYVVDLTDGNVYDNYIDSRGWWTKPVRELGYGRQVVLTNE